MKKIKTYVLGMVQVNCYVLWNDQHVLIIDPGSASQTMIKDIDDQGGIVDGIILTHGHFDHIGGVDALVEHYHCPLYMNAWDQDMLMDAYLNASGAMGLPEVIVHTKPQFLDAGCHTIGAFNIRFIYAPGHSNGCSMILWDDHLFSGDVLFAGSIGRTDLPDGDMSKMRNSLRIFKDLDPSIKIYPGHGPVTDLRWELQQNPYLNM